MPAQWPGESRNPLGEAHDDLLDIIPERLGGDADEVGREDGGRSRSLLIGGLLIGVAVAGAAGFYLLPRDSGTSGEVTPQLVTAEPTPYKVRPADPGGMQVPNQDKLVFERAQLGGQELRRFRGELQQLQRVEPGAALNALKGVSAQAEPEREINRLNKPLKS